MKKAILILLSWIGSGIVGGLALNVYLEYTKDVSIWEYIAGEITLSKPLVITLVVMAVSIIFFLGYLTFSYWKKLDSTVKSHQLRMEDSDFKTNIERNAFLQHQGKLHMEIGQLKGQVASRLTPKLKENKVLSDSEIDDAVNRHMYEGDYWPFKHTEMFRYFGDIIHRAHNNFAFSDVDNEVVSYYRSQGIIKLSTIKPYPDCFVLTSKGKTYAQLYYQEKYQKLP